MSIKNSAINLGRLADVGNESTPNGLVLRDEQGTFKVGPPTDPEHPVRLGDLSELDVGSGGGGGSVDETLVPIRHDFVYTGIYQDEVTEKAAYLLNGVMDPIDFPGDIATTTYFGSLPTVESSAFLLKRRVFNSPDVGVAGLGLYIGREGEVDATSELVQAFTTKGGVPETSLLPLYNAHYTSSPVANGLPGMINPIQWVKQSVHYVVESSSGMAHITRTRTLYRESALDPWEIGMDWNDEYFDPVPTSGSTGGVAEAPLDGKPYSRQSGGWSEIVAPTIDVTEAPADNKQYVRKNESWAEVVIPEQGIVEAPADGKQYARKDADWQEVVIPDQGVEEAPADGRQYVRKDTAWEEVSIPAHGVEEAPADGKQYVRKDEGWAEVESGGSEEPPLLTLAQCTTFTNLINALKVYGPHGPERFYAPKPFLGSTPNPAEDKMLYTRVGTLNPETLYGTFFAIYSRLTISNNDEITDVIFLSDGYGNAENYSRRLLKKDDTILDKSSGFYMTNYDSTTNKVSRKLVTVDGNGFVKVSSPIINLSSVGISTNSDPEIDQAVFTQLSTGVYEICNVPLLSRDGWYIETPKDRNNNVYFTLDYEEYPDERKLIIRTYEPDYSSGRAENGAPMDIIEGRFVALRFEGNEEE